jgi:hypothetical protein
MELAFSSETSVSARKTVRCHNPEGYILNKMSYKRNWGKAPRVQDLDPGYRIVSRSGCYISGEWKLGRRSN